MGKLVFIMKMVLNSCFLVNKIGVLLGGQKVLKGVTRLCRCFMAS